MINLDLVTSNGNQWLFEQLQSCYQPSFDINYKLIVNYTADIFKNSSAAGDVLTTFHEYLKILDFPYYFIELHTNKHDITDNLTLLKSIYAPTEQDISVVFISGNFQKTLDNSNTLCILPWIHIYANQQGLIGTCCLFNENFPIGDLRTTSLDEAVNSSNMRKIRNQMLNNEKPDICSTCWSKESQFLSSMRNDANALYLDQHLELITNTASDGSIDNFKLKIADIRVSNLCNLQCRMCSGKFSSKIAQEEKTLFKNSKYIDLTLADHCIDKVYNFLDKHLDSLENIYFAGGEPLLLESHYKILNLLLENNKSAIDLTYNTNLTQLKFKDIRVEDLWKKFSNVNVSASIDATHSRCTYVRHGSDYNIIKKNYNLIKHVVRNFKITSVISIFNLFDLIDLQKDWMQNENLSALQFRVDILVDPFHLSIQILPEKYKNTAKEYINQHISWLKSIADSEQLVLEWTRVLNFMFLKDEKHLLKEFFKITDTLDKNRRESFDCTFPEYAGLRNYIQ